METITQPIPYVEKEQISSLRFPRAEVLETDELRKKRLSNVEMGMRLGNNHRGKVKIVFEDEDGIKAVETTIWVGTEKNITLKGGAFIPLHRIHDIRIY